MGLDFELNDDNVLLISSGAVGAMGVAQFVFPNEVQDFVLSKEATRSPATWRCASHSLIINSAQGFAVRVGDDKKSKKTVLKVHGCAWATAGALTLYEAYGSNLHKEQPALGFATAAGLLASLCLYQGFKEEDKE